MADCSKRMWDLSPYDAYQCIWQSKDWQIVQHNSHRMWESFTSTTIGEWAVIAFSFGVMLPGMLMTYVLILGLPYILFQAYTNKSKYVPDRGAGRRLMLGGLYILSGGLFLFLENEPQQLDRFIYVHSLLQMTCGICLFISGVTWWAMGIADTPSQKQKFSTRRPR